MINKVGWSPKVNLFSGLEKTYSWIENQIKQTKTDLNPAKSYE